MEENHTDLNADELLYHYASSNKFDSAYSSDHELALLYPAEGNSYPSVNKNGEFDTSFQTGPKDEWKVGHSEVPNIFFTDKIPENAKDAEFGVAKSDIEYYLAFRIRDIVMKGFDVFECPTEEYDNIYNIPLTDEMALEIEHRKTGEV